MNSFAAHRIPLRFTVVHGGGVRIMARERPTARVSGCTFSSNVAAFGGGLNMTAEERAKIELTDSDFFDNEAGFGGGLFTAATGRLPAVIGGRISITSCRFLRNVANECRGVGVYGDGCFLDGGSPPTGNGQFLGGGADIRTVNGGVITVTSSLFAHNSGSPAGGISASSCQGGTIDLVNCTIVENEPGGVKVRLAIPDPPYNTAVPEFRVANSIVRGNGGATQIPIEILAGGPTAAVTFSNVEGGFAGLGNIDVPVTFAGSSPCDYRLAPGSVGIDAGNNEAVGPSMTTDLAGKPRFADDPATTDTGTGEQPIVDMGAYEFQQPLAAAGPGRRRAAGPETGVPCGLSR